MTTLRPPSVVMLFLLALLASPAVHAAEQSFALPPTTTCEFLTAEQAGQFLSTDDEFTRGLSDLDCKGRMEEAEDASRDAFMRFLGRQGRDWAGPEVNKVRNALEKLAPRLQELGVKLPAKIQLIKSSGKEESNNPYTRRSAIVLPQAFLQQASPAAMGNALAAKILILITRSDAVLQQKLCGLIGFEKINEPALPRRWAERQFTDPDFPRNDQAVEVTMQRKPLRVIPLLLSKDKTYDPKRVRDLHDFVDLKLAVLDEQNPSTLKLTPAGEPVFLDPRQVTGYPAQATANTNNNRHPLEVLADNFALLAQQRKAPNQKLLDDMAKVLKGETPAPGSAPAPGNAPGNSPGNKPTR